MVNNRPRRRKASEASNPKVGIRTPIGAIKPAEGKCRIFQMSQNERSRQIDLDNPAAVETPRSRWAQESPRPESLRRTNLRYCPRRVLRSTCLSDAGRIAAGKLMVAGMRFPVNPCLRIYRATHSNGNKPNAVRPSNRIRALSPGLRVGEHQRDQRFCKIVARCRDPQRLPRQRPNEVSFPAVCVSP